MKYKDINTFSIYEKYQSNTEERGMDWGDSIWNNRNKIRKRSRELSDFWKRHLLRHLSEDFWKLLSVSDKESIVYTYHKFDGTTEEFVRQIKKKHKDKFEDFRQITLRKLGI